MSANAIIDTRDLQVLYAGDKYTVAVSANMARLGWGGGQGVMWADSDRDEFLVDLSTGLYGGFMLWGSFESSDQLTALTGNQPLYGFGVLCAGGWIATTTTYERYTWVSRQSGGPLVPINYQVGKRLVFSSRGYWTPETNDGGGLNEYYVGSIVQAPSATNNWRLTFQSSI
jgi:hypothetical protein